MKEQFVTFYKYIDTRLVWRQMEMEDWGDAQRPQAKYAKTTGWPGRAEQVSQVCSY